MEIFTTTLGEVTAEPVTLGATWVKWRLSLITCESIVSAEIKRPIGELINQAFAEQWAKLQTPEGRDNLLKQYGLG